MPFNAISGVSRATIRHDFRGQQCINTMYFLHSSGAPSGLSMGALLAGLADLWSSNIMPLLSSDLLFSSILLRDLTTENGLEVVGDAGASGPGGAGDALPNNIAACVSVRTPFAGRHYRGRLYLGGIPRAAVAENTIDPAFQSDILTALLPFIGDGLVAAGWQWVVVAQSQKNPGTPPPESIPIPGGIVTPVTGVVFVDGIVDSQRRRLPGRGK